MRKFFLLLFIGCFITFFMLLSTIGCSSCSNKVREENTGEIKLVLMIVIDQLRADMVSRLENRFGEGGFRYLMEKGAWYKNARFRHCTTLTAVGHATIFTGAIPADHGIVGNNWIDRKSGKVISSVENMSPSQLTSTTISDQLILASGNRSRVFNVSLKDRGAILPGGFLGKAFWYNRKNGKFITSPFYYKKIPQWLDEWNNLKKVDQYRNKKWELLKEISTYIYGSQDDRNEETTYTGLSAVFPHSLAYQDDKYYIQLCNTPFADELTLELLIHLVNAEKVGQGSVTDLLTVSFSATDCIGHAYGPCSLEYEDNLLRVDATLARLFQFIDSTVGLRKTLIVLTGDHGVDLIPEFRQRLSMPAGRLDPKKMKKQVNDALQEKYKTNEDFVVGLRNPSIYLDLQVVEKLKLDLMEVERAAVEVLLKMEGIGFAVSRSDLLKGNLPDTPILKSLEKAFHPKRSGNILIIQEPFWFMYHVHDKDSSMHGSPFSYDTHVPVFFCGPGIKKRTVYRLVCPGDIAPTISLKLGIEAPSGSSGKPLVEILK
jgi:predicted AlkP superfamily pyrophosphatase or phosphodiesterase